MKTRNLLIAATVAALLAAYCFLGTGYRAQLAKKRALAAQIDEATRQLAGIPAPPADLSQRRAAVSASVERGMSLFPERLNSTRIIDAIFKLASASGVRALPAVTRPWTGESVAGLDYPVFRLSLTASGTYRRVADFLDRLENGDLATLIISEITVEGTINPEDERGKVEAAVDIAVYARPSPAPANGNNK